MSECHYVNRPDQLRVLRERVGDGFPAECAGPVCYRYGKFWYCDAHGSWHHALNPFGGYVKIAPR